MKTSVIVLGLCAAATLFAQGPPPGRGPGRMGPGGPMGPGMMGMGPGMNRTVTGAPYSAQEVTETSQTLSNGNAISRKTQSNVYRDSSGRVRTETTVPAHRGPGETTSTSAGETTRTIVNIHDPVAGVSHELDPQAKTDRQITLPANRGNGAGPGGRAGRGGAAAQTRTPTNDPNVVTETLAMQTINGVQATGTRVTRTIPAGQIGNAQPIQIVRETWQSPDLKVPVMVKTSDPRFGTTTTQLTNITRSEPDPSLFQVPSDYTVTKGRGPGMRGGQQPGNVVIN
jgi:hypothetical protein